MTDLSGRRVLTVVTNYGVEQDELVVPVSRLRDAGAEVVVAAVSDEPVRTLVGDEDPGQEVTPGTTLDAVDPAGFDLLLVPGGTINADTLRTQDRAVEILRAFTGSGRPVAAICHGPWLLVEADAVRDRSLTSYPSLRTDVTNAGGRWTDEEVVVDDAQGWTSVTSRDPGDLDAFVGAITQVLAAR